MPKLGPVNGDNLWNWLYSLNQLWESHMLMAGDVAKTGKAALRDNCSLLSKAVWTGGTIDMTIILGDIVRMFVGNDEPLATMARHVQKPENTLIFPGKFWLAFQVVVNTNTHQALRDASDGNPLHTQLLLGRFIQATKGKISSFSEANLVWDNIQAFLR